MSDSSNLSAIVVAAGGSQRMGFDKLVAPLFGRPLIEHSLAAFQDCEEVDSIILVCGSGRLDEFSKIAMAFSKVVKVVAGGKERVDSVLNGLAAFAPQQPVFVAVHDGARPLITPAAISACYRAALETGAAACAEPVSDTLHRTNNEGIATETVSRKNLWRMQTPQIMETEVLESLLQDVHAKHGAITDEISLLIHSGIKAKMVETPDLNFKVTYPRDLQLAEKVLKGRAS